MTTTRPPEASRAGKNRYYHTCEPVGASRHYGICLFTLEAFERGQELSETPCVEAMRNGTCPALAMREQEREAGHSLYYVEPDPANAVNPQAAARERASVNTSHPSYQRGRYGSVWGSSESQQKAKPKAGTNKPKAGNDEFLEFNAASVVNQQLSIDVLKQQMVEAGKPAAQRRQQAIANGETIKKSLIDYMTADELARLKAIKTQLSKVQAA